MAKAYSLSFDFVLHGMSYTNILLYSSVLPPHDFKKDDEEIAAGDPENNDKVIDFFKNS